MFIYNVCGKIVATFVQLSWITLHQHNFATFSLSKLWKRCCNIILLAGLVSTAGSPASYQYQYWYTLMCRRRNAAHTSTCSRAVVKHKLKQSLSDWQGRSIYTWHSLHHSLSIMSICPTNLTCVIVKMVCIHNTLEQWFTSDNGFICLINCGWSISRGGKRGYNLKFLKKKWSKYFFLKKIMPNS